MELILNITNHPVHIFSIIEHKVKVSNLLRRCTIHAYLIANLLKER